LPIASRGAKSATYRSTRTSLSLAGMLSVALDATPLIGPATGVGEFCAGALGALAQRPEVEVNAFAVTWRRRHELAPHLPPGARLRDRPMPARPLHIAWSYVPFPPIEAFVGVMDVVHGTNFVVPPARRAATVVTVHDLTVVHFPEMCQKPTLAYPRLVRQAVRRGAWVHTPSQFVAREVTELLGVPPERVRAVHHGVPESSPAGARAADLLPRWVERYVLAVGTVEPRKDLPTLVRAFGLVAPSLPGLALVIAGPEGWGAGALDEAVEASPARDRVVRLGWVERPSRGALLKEALLLAYPSLYEGFGFPPLEAMAAGTPVVATRSGALPEVLGEAAWFVEVGETEALAEAIAKLAGDEAARAEFAARGRRQAALYTWERCAAGLEALYRDALDEKH
jgi:glycosyltransferase involved in cell wall biosynthesis